MQVRRSRRAVAAVTAVALILVAWLGAYHEADVAHVRDGAGHVVHAQELADHHATDTAAHLHGRAEHPHADGACALLATLHARASTGFIAVTTVTAIAAGPRPALAAIPPSIAPYRIAPKTSPPARG